MAKTLVVEQNVPDTKIPFLRGILTRSLQDTGLSFEDAYSLASAVRDELAETDEITTGDLRQLVVDQLSSKFGAAVIQRYQAPATGTWTTLVRHTNGKTTPFSREQHRRHLESSGLSYEDSTAVTAKIFNHLMKRGTQEISSRHLARLTYFYLRRSLGADSARRFLVLVEFFRGRRPLVLLIGGAPGCGKSEVAMEIGHRLQIGRTQSTDLLREVMRMMIPERLLPMLHTSSFEAWRTLHSDLHAQGDADATLGAGYQAQADLLSVACEAVIKRSFSEQTSLVLEGVHISHSLMAKLPDDAEAIVIPVMLAVLNPNQLRERFSVRGDQAEDRRADRYLESFDAIWRLQSLLLSDADRWQIPIILNNHKEQVIRDVMKMIIDHLLVGFTATPRDVFA